MQRDQRIHSLQHLRLIKGPDHEEPVLDQRLAVRAAGIDQLHKQGSSGLHTANMARAGPRIPSCPPIHLTVLVRQDAAP